jgi:hypothetical protein
MSATLKLTRNINYFIIGRPFELRRGPFEVSVDGKNVGSLENHETFETSLKPGHHTLKLRNGRYSSRDCSFESAEGEVVNFRCHGAALWPTYVASIAKPDMAISLKQE